MCVCMREENVENGRVELIGRIPATGSGVDTTGSGVDGANNESSSLS